MEKQLMILSESLDSKTEILEKLLQDSILQQQLITQENPDLEAYDKVVEEKDQLIDRITHLDDGFEALYEKLSEGLQQNKERYAVQIRNLKQKIEKVTELSVKVQKQEAVNKELLDEYFRKQRGGIRQNRTTARAAYGYYKQMSSISSANSSFVDNKYHPES